MTSHDGVLWACTLFASVLALGCADYDDVPGLDEGEDGVEVAEPEADLGDVSDDALVKAQPPAPPIVSVKLRGTGCKSESAKFTPGRTSFRLDLASLVANVGARGPGLAVKDCVVSVALKGVPRVSYALASYKVGVDFNVARGATGFYGLSAGLQGGAPNKEQRKDLKGPTSAKQVVSYAVQREQLTWTPCGKDRVINLPLRVQARRAPSGASKVAITKLESVTIRAKGC